MKEKDTEMNGSVSVSNETFGSTAVSFLVTDKAGDIHIETTIVYYPEKSTHSTTVTNALAGDSEMREDFESFDENQTEKATESTTSHISVTTQKTALELPDDIW